MVADCSSYDSATTENDGEVDMQGKRRSACCLHSNLSDADCIADAKVLLLNWSATTLWLLSIVVVCRDIPTLSLVDYICR